MDAWLTEKISDADLNTEILSDRSRLSESPSFELSIVMPCLNEADSLESCIKKAQTFLQAYEIAGEIIVADNGSTDGSQAIAKRLGVRVVDVETRGYGSALMGGIAAARGKFVIMGDADDSYDFSALLPFVAKLREGYDLVVGNRFKGGIKPGAMPVLHKYLGNPVLTAIGRLFFKSPAGDFHCGLRAFSKAAVQNMDLRTKGMEFASEMILKATLLGMRITEVPTTLSPDGRKRPPHLRTWQDGWRHLRFMLLYSPRWLFLYPGALLILFGLIVGLWLLPGPRTIGNVTLDVHTLLYAALAVFIGFQALEFATFTKIFAISEGLLPEDERLNKLFRYLNLERGLLVGTIVAVAGLVCSVYAVSDWGAHSFGNLNPTITLRMVIPAVLLLALGCQIILSSFFLSVLGLRRR
jgi:glycosyltransferase involved in cell wall biosynthesis